MGLVLLGTGDVIQLGATLFLLKLALLLCQYYQVNKP